MNKQKLVDLFKQPSAIDAKHLTEIEVIVNENPYFHSAYALIALGRKKISPKGANKDLIRAAIYATNRVNLKKYLEAGLGGSQASSQKDAIVDKPLPTKKVVSKKSPTDSKPEVVAKTPPPTQKTNVTESQSDKITTITRPTDIDLEKILDTLKSEYKQLEVNMKNFDQAEKSLTASEVKEASEAKKPRGVTKKPAKSTKATKPTPAAKKATVAKKTTKATAKKVISKTTVKKKPSSSKTAGTDTKSEDIGSKKKEQSKLIDQFIKSEPKITPKKDLVSDTGTQEDLSSKNQVLTDDMVTENLATIMIKQGRFEKAIEIYNKLIWKFPHKKAYFAGRIKELKEQ